MAKFRKKPVVIEAFQIPAPSEAASVECPTWAMQAIIDKVIEMVPTGGAVVHTLEGDMVGGVGDWIIRGVKGEFYPCKPDIFAETYEAASDRG